MTFHFEIVYSLILKISKIYCKQNETFQIELDITHSPLPRPTRNEAFHSTKGNFFFFSFLGSASEQQQKKINYFHSINEDHAFLPEFKMNCLGILV